MLALSFLGSFVHGVGMTWSPSLEVERNGSRLEYDFACWWERRLREEREPSLVFGECKSFNAFTTKDFNRIDSLIASFPAAFIVLATLREKLNRDEIRGATALARKRRAFGSRALNYSPVIILTGHELFNAGARTDLWTDFAGGLPKSADLTLYDADLRALAATTQHLHLGIAESYG